MRRLRHKFTQFHALPGERKREFWSDWAGLQLLAAMFVVLGFKRSAAFVKRRAHATRPPPENPHAAARESARLVDAAARNTLIGKNCLRESLWLWRQLRRQGIEAKLRIGAPVERDSNSEWEAHAWVELDGQVLNDRPNVRNRYSEFSGFAEAWDSL